MASGRAEKRAARKSEYIGFTLPRAVRVEIQQIATRNERSLSAQLRLMLTREIERVKQDQENPQAG